MQSPPPRQSPVRLDACNLAASFGIIGDRWSLLILRSALYGVRRFDDFKSELGIPRTILSDRLKKLVSAGIMTRRDYQIPGSRPRPEYILTQMGEELRLPFLAMTQWADTCLAGDKPKPLKLIESATGSDIRIGMINGEGVEVPADRAKFLIAEWARTQSS
jgi:DNA-binding HxlR family transcriptional regulator